MTGARSYAVNLTVQPGRYASVGGSSATLGNRYRATTGTAISDPAHSYTYTALNQLAGFDTSSFGYDAADNLTRLASGATVGYDVANQATSYTSPTGTATPLTYDASGDRTAGPAPAGATGAYTYDQAARLSAATSTTTGASASAASLIAAGQYHSLAVNSAGAVWAWGYNANGQLGNGTTTSTDTPVKVTGAPPAAAITAGALSSVELTRTGTLSAWGYNANGQLGNGTTTSSSTPVSVPGLSAVKGSRRATTTSWPSRPMAVWSGGG